MPKREKGPRFIKRLPAEISGPIRERVKAHIDAGRPLQDLGIEPNRPAAGLAFAVVGHTPKARSKDARHRCSYCETENKFDAGPIVYMSDERLRFIGPDCWDDHFESDAFKEEKRDYNLYMRRLEFSEVRGELVSEVRRYLVSLEDQWAEVRTSVAKADTLGERIGKQMSPVYQAPSSAKRIDGRLEVERKATARRRDIQAETEIAGVARTRRQVEFNRETVATLYGLSLLEPRHAAHHIARGIERLAELGSLLSKVRWLEISLAEFGSHYRAIELHLKATFEGVERVNGVIADVKALLSRPSLASMTRWARDPDSTIARIGDFSVDGNNLRFERRDGSLARVEFPDPDSMRPLPDSELLRRLVRGL